MEAFIGTIASFGFNFAPRAWSTCAGQSLAISSNQALFALLGTAYGGDGRTSFSLPDLRGRTALGFGHGPGLRPWNIGAQGGLESEVLNVQQMPSHSHTATFTPAAGAPIEVTVEASTDVGETATPAEGSFLAQTVPGPAGPDQPEKIYRSDAGAGTVLLGGITVTGGGSSGTVAVGQTGNNLPVNVIQPGLAINYCIAMLGIFPSRN